MSQEALIKSLFRREVKVLYWKCKGEQYKQIGLRFRRKDGTPYTEDWVQKQVTSAYKRLGVPEGSKEEKSDYLDQHFCEEILNLKEEELNTWPLYGWKTVEKEGHTAYEEKTKKDLPKAEEKETRQSTERVEPDEEEEEETKPEPPPAGVAPVTELPNADVVSQPRSQVADEDDIQSRSPGTPPVTQPAEERKEFEFRPPRNQPINRLWLVVPFLICLACLWIGWTTGDRILAFFAPHPTLMPSDTPGTPPSFTPRVPGTQQPTQAPTETSTPQNTETPANTATPEIPPTAVPLPIIEHFNEPMKDVWEVTGDPILTTTETSYRYIYDGVLTTLENHFASIAVGNTAWSDYIINIRVFHEIGSIFLGFRVQDLANMFAIECEAWNCNWVVIQGGVKEIITEASGVYMQDGFTLTVEGENFNGVTTPIGGFPERRPFLVLPPKYQGKFLNGGIYIRFKDVEIDYIEILDIR